MVPLSLQRTRDFRPETASAAAAETTTIVIRSFALVTAVNVFFDVACGDYSVILYSRHQ